MGIDLPTKLAYLSSVPPETVESPAPASLGRDAILAQLDAAETKEAAPVKGEVAEVEADEEAAPVEAAADGDSVEEDDADEDDSADDETNADPKVQKGLDAVRRAETRHRAQMERDRAEFAAEKAKHTERVAKLDEYEDAAKRVKYDPAALLKKLGVVEDDFEMIAHAIYAESKAGSVDPNRKAAAAQRLRDREKDDKYTAIERKQAELEKRIEADKAERESAAHADRYIGEINTAAKAKFPLVAHMMTAAPEDVSDGLQAAFERLQAKTGKTPKPAEVVAEMDRKERARLKALGVDADALLGTKATIATVKAAAKVNGTAKAANSNVPKTRAEILAELESLAT